MAEKIYSEIPVRTWRWLGVNEAGVEEAVLAENKETGQRLAVPAGESRELTVVYRHEGQGTIDIKVAKDSFLKLTVVQLLPSDLQYAGQIEIELAEGARLEAVAVEAGAQRAVSRMQVLLKGDNSRADVYVLYFGDEARSLDMNYVLVQEGRQTEAVLKVCGALCGQADKIFRGTLDFRHGSKGSKGCEDEQVIVLSGRVRNRSVPLMLSGEDAVEGRHAVSIGKMDENRLFYLMSRGLDMAEAKKLVVEAAFRPVLDKIADGELCRELDDYIKERLSDE